mgnify:CR=1 FL=1
MMTTPKNHTIDAAGKRLGRVASEAAKLLMDKDSAAFEKHKKAGARVHITNAGKLAITEKRAAGTTYNRFSGYPGGLKVDTLTQIRTRLGIAEVMRRTIKGMLPANKLRPEILKRLTVSE